MIDELLLFLFASMIVIYVSWILLYFLPSKKIKDSGFYPSISIILPAHNEEDVIRESIESALKAFYPGEREVVVVNDGSQDRTGVLAREVASLNKCVKVIDIPHSGKAEAINTAALNASGEIIVVVDADSRLSLDALKDLVAPFSDERVGAVSGVIRAEMNYNPLTWFQDIEYMMSSTWRFICNKLNGTYLLPGFTAFRRKAFNEVGGFRRDTLCEDFDIGLRLRKAGYTMVMSDAVLYTHVPQNIPSLIRQRLRWSRGTLQVVRKHSDIPFNLRYGAVGFYGIPTQLYWFLHASISLPITFYQILYGYLTYFASHQNYFSVGVLSYFFNWFSLYGMIDYSVKSITGVYPMTTVFILCFTSFFLGTAYMVLSILKHSRIDVRHLIALFFFSPYSLFCLIVFTAPLFVELNPFREKRVEWNIWTK